MDYPDGYVAPHKRNFCTQYRAAWWNLLVLEEKPDKTQEDRQGIITLRGQLDLLWGKMSLGQRLDIDPAFEIMKKAEGRWTEMKLLMCPNCGWLHQVTKNSDGPPRCSVCMTDVDIL